jgi:hypothetical protein
VKTVSETNRDLVQTNGKYAPQHYNPELDVYQAVRGEDGAPYSIQLGTRIKDSFSGSATITKTYTNSMRGFVIMNDDATNDLTFTINNLTMTVKAGEGFDGQFDPFTSVTVTTTVAFRAVVKS